ncbi:hypothetical protein XPA_009547 [Xanthoria parietina]
MSSLNTPTRAEDEIRRIQLDLSAKWGLRFPQPGLRSPAKRKLDQPEEKALDRLKFLYFHDLRCNQAAKDYAVREFEEIAPKLLAGWVYKTGGDPDVLPSRTRSGARRQDNFLAMKPELNDEQASDLMQALLRSLTSVVENVRKGAIFEKDPDSQKGKIGVSADHNTPQNKESKSARKPSRTLSEKANSKTSNQQKNGNIRDYMKQTSTEALQPLGYPLSKDPQPSSDDYMIDDGLFNDVEMQDAPANLAPEVFPNVKSNFLDTTMAFSESNESLEDVYQSAPDSPSKVNTLSRTVSMRKQRQSAVKSPVQVSQCHGPSENAFGQGRKRAHPAQPKPDLPRKVSRDSSSIRSFGAIPNQPFGSTTHTAPYPQNMKVDDRHRWPGPKVVLFRQFHICDIVRCYLCFVSMDYTQHVLPNRNPWNIV